MNSLSGLIPLAHTYLDLDTLPKQRNRVFKEFGGVLRVFGLIGNRLAQPRYNGRADFTWSGAATLAIGSFGTMARFF
jgi:hypothetical protein